MQMNISKGRLKAMPRFDTMHMDTCAFSSNVDCRKDMLNKMFYCSSGTKEQTTTIHQNCFRRKKTLLMYDTTFMVFFGKSYGQSREEETGSKGGQIFRNLKNIKEWMQDMDRSQADFHGRETHYKFFLQFYLLISTAIADQHLCCND